MCFTLINVVRFSVDVCVIDVRFGFAFMEILGEKLNFQMKENPIFYRTDYPADTTRTHTHPPTYPQATHGHGKHFTDRHLSHLLSTPLLAKRGKSSILFFTIPAAFSSKLVMNNHFVYSRCECWSTRLLTDRRCVNSIISRLF